MNNQAVTNLFPQIENQLNHIIIDWPDYPKTPLLFMQ